MQSKKQKLAIGLLILALAVIVAMIWYCIAGMNKSDKRDGTLVKEVSIVRMMCNG